MFLAVVVAGEAKAVTYEAYYAEVALAIWAECGRCL